MPSKKPSTEKINTSPKNLRASKAISKIAPSSSTTQDFFHLSMMADIIAQLSHEHPKMTLSEASSLFWLCKLSLSHRSVTLSHEHGGQIDGQRLPHLHSLIQMGYLREGYYGNPDKAAFTEKTKRLTRYICVYRGVSQKTAENLQHREEQDEVAKNKPLK